ncbi:hypothetical protein BaRGS_00003244, partial [Batillaria attramentaria]
LSVTTARADFRLTDSVRAGEQHVFHQVRVPRPLGGATRSCKTNSGHHLSKLLHDERGVKKTPSSQQTPLSPFLLRCYTPHIKSRASRLQFRVLLMVNGHSPG